MAESPRLLDVMDVCGLTGPSWAPWRVVGKCLDGMPLDRDEQALYERCTGRMRPPTEPPAEFYVVIGTRAGKSRFAGALAVRAAGFQRYNTLALGENAGVGLAAADREQAKVLYGYAVAPFQDDRLKGLTQSRSRWQALRSLVLRQTLSELHLKTGGSVEVRTANFGRIRGRTYAHVVADELAFWSREDGSNPASEVLSAIRPGLAR